MEGIYLEKGLPKGELFYYYWQLEVNMSNGLIGQGTDGGRPRLVSRQLGEV